VAFGPIPSASLGHCPISYFLLFFFIFHLSILAHLV
jgi:hypothetical protein